MSRPRVLVLDWGGGNLGSVLRGLERAGADPALTRDPDAVRHGERLVFPGVGAFGAVMAALDSRGLREPLAERLRAADRPFLGICVGLQALFYESEEAPGVCGLGILPGAVARLRARKVPQVGWNEVVPAIEAAARAAAAAEAAEAQAPAEAAAGLVEPGYAYFVNSYAAPAPAGAPWVAARTDHEGAFASAVQRGPLLAVQFHPEKSAAYGARLLARWLAASGSAEAGATAPAPAPGRPC